MKKFQKTIAAIMALTTAMSAGTITSFAEGESSVNGTAVNGAGSFEGTVEAIKYNMILPTTPADGTYDFILDPQGLIEQTGADRFGGTYDADSFEDGQYIFFKNTASDGAVTYSEESDVLTAYNLSNKAVKLTVSGTVTGVDGLTFTSATPTEGLNIQLSIADSNGTNNAYFEVAEGATDATATYEAQLDAVDPGNFEIVWDSTLNDGDGGYTYGYTSEFNNAITAAAGDYSQVSDAKSAGFKLVGAVANDADGSEWKGYNGTPSVSLVWSMADPTAVPAEKAPSLANTNIPVNTSGHTITFDLGTGDAAATGLATKNPVMYKEAGSSSFVVLGSNYSYSNGTLTFNAKAGQALTDGAQVKVTFNDAANTEIVLTFVASN